MEESKSKTRQLLDVSHELIIRVRRFVRCMSEFSSKSSRSNKTSAFELLETRALLSSTPLITEFMASNDTTLADGDGNYSDWVEIYNPTASVLDLSGWSLTDDANDLNRWEFPDTNQSELDPGEFLVVFASGQQTDNYVDAGGNLHTNFGLSSNGEYLALVEPDGVTIAQQFAPEFPDQVTDVSFGLDMNATTSILVDQGAPASILVPSDGSLGNTWHATNFDDSTWQQATTSIGYETGIADSGEGPHHDFESGISNHTFVATDDAHIQRGSPNANFGTASDLIIKNTSQNQFQRKTYLQFDVSSATLSNLTDAKLHLAVTETDQTYTVNVYGVNEGVDTWDESTITWDNAPANNFFSGGGTPASGGGITSDGTFLGQFTVSVGDVGGVIDFSNAESAATDALLDFISADTDGAVSFALTRVEATLPNLLTFASSEHSTSAWRPTLELVNGVSTPINTDLESDMRSVNGSAYVRIPFNVTDASTLDSLDLEIQYDDGFVAYINGMEVARRNAPGNLQSSSTATDFRLDADALTFEQISLSSHLSSLQNGTNVLAIQALNHTVDGNDFLLNPILTATDSNLNAASALYLNNPTPRNFNDTTGAFSGFVADTKFSTDRGYYDQPIDVEITSATPDAVIYYTLDGTDPVPGVGTTQEYTTSLAINSTTTLRAIATKVGMMSTDIDTQTYLYPSDILNQPVLPSGYPSTWGGGNGRMLVGADYEIDPDIKAMHTNQELLDAFLEIPTIALSLPQEELFNPQNGIYSNPQMGGQAWERGVAVEYLDTNDEPGFAVDAGLRVHGGASRGTGSLGGNPTTWSSFKLSMRLLFKQEYGPTTLDYPLFDTSSIDSINTLVLDGYWQNSLQHDNQPFTLQAQYVRDILLTDLQRATGSYSPHQTYSHLFINGLYWGLYILHERPDDAALAEHFGGAREDYDVIHNNVNDVIAGTNNDLTQLYNLANGNISDPTQYAQVQALLDIPQFADYALLNLWGATRDWGPNWYAARNSEAGDPFQFYSWDSELILNGVNENIVTQGAGSNTPQGLDRNLRDNTEYLVTFGDRAHAMLFNDGILTANRVSEFLEDRLTQIEDAVVLEYARWGDLRDHHPTAPYTVADWEAERAHLNNVFFPLRESIFLNQLINEGLYPSTVAPMFNQHGGQVTNGFGLTITAPTGTIYYTLDGTDPRQVGGSLSPTAIAYSGSSIDISEGVTVKARVRSGRDWSALNEADFVVAPPADATSLRITELNYNPHDANSTAGTNELDVDNDQFEFVELRNIGVTAIELSGVQFVEVPDGTNNEGIEFTFGQQSLAAGDYVLVVKNQAAFESRYGVGLNVAGEYDGKLSNGGELITVLDVSGTTIHSFEYNDSGDWPALADGDGSSLEVIDTAGDYDSPFNWKASAATGGTPGSSTTSGDFDGDNDVDGADFLAWQRGYGITVGATLQDGDANDDGSVDAADLIVWESQFGDTGMPLVASARVTDEEINSTASTHQSSDNTIYEYNQSIAVAALFAEKTTWNHKIDSDVFDTALATIGIDDQSISPLLVDLSQDTPHSSVDAAFSQLEEETAAEQTSAVAPSDDLLHSGVQTRTGKSCTWTAGLDSQ